MWHGKRAVAPSHPADVGQPPPSHLTLQTSHPADVDVLAVVRAEVGTELAGLEALALLLAQVEGRPGEGGGGEGEAEAEGEGEGEGEGEDKAEAWVESEGERK